MFLNAIMIMTILIKYEYIYLCIYDLNYSPCHKKEQIVYFRDSYPFLIEK